MKTALERRVAALEQRSSVTGRQIHIIKAIDYQDRDRQLAELIAAGKAGHLNGFLCLTGMSGHQ